LLLVRGVGNAEQAERFLSPQLSDLHSPYLMLGMKKTVERLEAAIERKEKILIYGDYDVDGTTAVVILKVVFELCGGIADFHVPHRMREGYGMRDEVIERAAAEGIRLIVSVDTGIRAFQAAETCKRLGLELIVTDHHLPSEGLPEALTVLNPNQHGCEYPCKALCGAGVAFKIAQALLEKTGRERLVPSFLKIVAIATIADAVPLVGENRVFAKLGLEGLRSPVNPGLKALLEVAGVGTGPLRAGDVAFRLAPRLNAAGRMDVARDVVELFTLKDQKQAREVADRLNQLNIERQAEEAKTIAEIDAKIAADTNLREAYCMVVDGEGWHKGVIGITASRVVDKYGRPALVITREGPDAQGSGRSIHSFHLLDALDNCAHLFTRYGGHAYAAGFALPSERIGELRASLDAWAHAHLTPEDLEPVMSYDIEIRLEQVTPDLFQSLHQLEPFGMGNPEPVFVARNVRVLQPVRVVKDKHAKLRVGQSSNGLTGYRCGEQYKQVFDAMAWRMADRVQQESLAAGDLIDLGFTVDENQHPDFGGLQLSVYDYARPQAASATTTK
jgi:single-stranded-DNA-specific exonuclease